MEPQKSSALSTPVMVELPLSQRDPWSNTDNEGTVRGPPGRDHDRGQSRTQPDDYQPTTRERERPHTRSPSPRRHRDHERRSRSIDSTRSRSRSRSREHHYHHRHPRSRSRQRSPRHRSSPPRIPRMRTMPAAPEDDPTMQQLARVMRNAQRRELPRRGSRKAPVTWDGQPASLRTFFRELETMFEDYGVEGRERATAVPDYVGTIPEGMIRELEGYRNRNYAELKRELLELTGQQEDRPRYRVADLNALTRELSTSTIRTAKEFEEAYLRFMQMSQWLMRHGKLREDERDYKFWDMFSDSMRNQLHGRLAIKLPDHPRSEPYPMKDVCAAARYLLEERFDSQAKGDSRTWLERERAKRSSTRPHENRPSSHRRRSLSPSYSSDDSRPRSRSSRSGSPPRRDTRVRWEERDKNANKGKDVDDGMLELLDRMGRLSVNDPEYHQNYQLMQRRNSRVAMSLRPPVYASLPEPAAIPQSRSLECFYCAKTGCRISACPTLREHLSAGWVKPDPSNPKFVVFKDGTRLFQHLVGGRAADVAARVKSELDREARPPPHQASFIRLGPDSYDDQRGSTYLHWVDSESADEWDEWETEARIRQAMEAVRAKKAPRVGTPYDRGTTSSSASRRGRSKGEPTETAESQVAPSRQNEVAETKDEAMGDIEPRRSRPPAQYRYSSKAEKSHDDEAYLNKILDLPLSGSSASVRLRDIIGSSLPLRKGLLEYLKTQRVPIEIQATPAIVAALGVPEPLLHSRLERFPVCIAGREMVVLKDEGLEINLINSNARRTLGLPLDVNHRIFMQGVNPGSRRSKGLCENVNLATGGVEMRVHLHVFPDTPFDILLGQPWKTQYVVSERRNRERGTLEMVVSDYRNSLREVAVTLRDLNDHQWESRLDSMQLPRPRRHDHEPDSQGHSQLHADAERFERHPSGISPSSVEESSEGEEWAVQRALWMYAPNRHTYKSKYKPVARKVRPVDGVLPEAARTSRQFPEDPLAFLPPIPHKPPDFIPGTRLTSERLMSLDFMHNDFLWPEERKLLAHVLCINEHALAFDESEKGRFRDDYFSPYRIATIPHEPWQEKPIPIGPGIWPKVAELVKQKIKNGTYEWSQSCYRGRIFPVLKKDGSPRLVHDMQKLNAVTIRDSTLPPNIEDVVDSFAGKACYTVFDIFVGYENRTLAAESRDLTSFHVPGFGLLRLTSLPMGATNAMAEFQACMTFILQDEIPGTAMVFVDDCGVKGPLSRYECEAGFETMPENPAIRRFIWEHAHDVNRVLHRIGHAGATVSALKLQLAVSEVHLLGSVCTYEGRLPDESKVARIMNWPECSSVTEVWGFLGTCGVVRAWIKGYSIVARPLTTLLRKDQPWKWGAEERDAMTTLKDLVANAPCLAPLDCTTNEETVLAVDSSSIAVGFILYQLDSQGRRRPVRFGSLTFNSREARYSQAKLELYGLFRALRKWRPYLVSVRKLVVEVDAQYIRGMLNSPELVQNAVVGRWVEEISTYAFQLRHVRAADHSAADGLSRRRRAPEDSSSSESEREIEGDSRVVTIVRMDGWQPDRGFWALPGVTASERPVLEPDLEAVQRFLLNLDRATGVSDDEARATAKWARKFFIHDGRLWKRHLDGQHQLVSPIERRRELMAQAHDELGHKGTWSTIRQLKLRVWWLKLEKDVAEFIKTCEPCQKRNPRNVQLPVQVSSPATPFRRLHADVVFLPQSHGYCAAVLARDDLTGYIEGRRLRKVNAKSIGAFMWEDVITRWGALIEIVTDNGNKFKGAVEVLLKRHNIHQIRISAYNKRANGVVERGHRTFREALLRSCEHPGDWPQLFHAALWAERATVRKATGYSPYFLAHGAHPLLPFDITDATFLFGRIEPLTTADLICRRIQMLAGLDKTIASAQEQLTRSRYRSKEQFERAHASSIRRESLPAGTPVLVRNSRFDSEFNAKSHDRWLGPYVVIRVGRNGAYRLAELDGAVLDEPIAAGRVIEFFPRKDWRMRVTNVIDGTGWSRLQDNIEAAGEGSEEERASEEE